MKSTFKICAILLHVFIFSIPTLGQLIPQFDWVRQFGGVSDEKGDYICVDTDGNIYSTGNFIGTVDFDPGSGTYLLTTDRTSSYISKLDSSGNFLWAKFVKGYRYNPGNCLFVDALENIYLLGDFWGTIDFDPGPDTYNLETSTSFCDIFILKLDPSGNFLWARKVGASNEYDHGRAISVDAFGNVYTIGNFQGTADFDPGDNVYNLTSYFWGINDIFILKLDPSGNFLWAKQFGGIEDKMGCSISVDASGNVYSTGYFKGKVDFDPGTGKYELTSIGYYNTFISKLDASGNFLWAKKFGGVNINQGQSITIDVTGNVYLTGHFDETTDFDPDIGTYNLTSGHYSDIYVSKLDPSGNFLWAKQLGGNIKDEGYSVAVDDVGNVYSTGYFKSTADFDPGITTYKLTTSTLYFNAYISKLDPSGNFMWAGQLGGGGADDLGFGISLDDFGNIYLTGQFAGTSDFDPGVGTYNLESIGGSDVFILKMSQNIPVAINEIYIGDIILYPNPTTGMIYSNIKDVTGLEINVFNNIGVKIKTISKNQIDLSDEKSGIYFITIKTNNQLLRSKIIKY